MTIRLSVSHLSARYGDRRTLRDVSLHLRAGEHLALLGANGAGKTTLLYHLDGLLAPEAGEIHLEGTSLSRVSGALRRWRQAVGLLFQNPDDQLFGPTVLDDVMIGPRNTGATAEEARARALGVLRQLGVERLRAEPVHALSLGQRRTVALAGVLVTDPSVLLLDEPTQGLDAGTEEALLAAVDGARQRGVSVLMATHDVDLACRWADRVVVLDHGRVLREGPVERVLDDATLAQASLRRPWVLEVGRALRALDILPSTAPLPTSGAALVDALSRLTPRDRNWALAGRSGVAQAGAER